MLLFNANCGGFSCLLSSRSRCSAAKECRVQIGKVGPKKNFIWFNHTKHNFGSNPPWMSRLSVLCSAASFCWCSLLTFTFVKTAPFWSHCPVTRAPNPPWQGTKLTKANLAAFVAALGSSWHEYRRKGQKYSKKVGHSTDDTMATEEGVGAAVLWPGPGWEWRWRVARVPRSAD